MPNVQNVPPLAAAPAPPPPPPPPVLHAPQGEFDEIVGDDPEPEPFELTDEDRAALLAGAAEAQAPARRGRGWLFKTAGLAALGLALLGGAAILKFGHVPGLPKTPPFIAAAEGPTKVQPPSDATVQSSGDAGALLMKDSASSAPVKIVSSEEQPVDLHAQTPSPSPSPTAASATPIASPVNSPAANALSPVAPASDTPIVAPAEATASVAPLFPDAKPVKTVSVRPDGTLISADVAANPGPTPTPMPAARSLRLSDGSSPSVGANPEPATPNVDLPTKLSPKSTARIVAKTDTTAPAAATDTTPSPPLHLGNSSSPSKSPKTPAAAPSQVADATASDAPDATDAASRGGWAVQLAAPRSEADAQSAIARLKSKYADALGGSELGIRKADVKGETIYRVRVGGLSKADAAALCAKLKTSGGDCFIAKN